MLRFFKNFIIFSLFFVSAIFIKTNLDIDKDTCMDSGFCKIGLRVNIQSGKQITINKKSCIDNKGKWLQKKQVCNFANTLTVTH